METTTKFKHISIQKNRGWRGLAQVLILDEAKMPALEMVFSFSQLVWTDMLAGDIVLQDKDNYYIVHFDNTEHLPAPTQQRSVLIKNFNGNITSTDIVAKGEWNSTTGKTWNLIYHFTKNTNNHTKSDWNNVGIRVMPY